MAATPLTSAERVQQSLCLLQIERVLSFPEPSVDRRKQFARFTSSAHANPKACEARRRAKLERLGLLAASNLQRVGIGRLGSPWECGCFCAVGPDADREASLVSDLGPI